MRCLLVASLLAGLAGNAYSHHISNTAPPSIKLRKSLGFGPQHPHASYDTGVAFQPTSFAPKSDLEVAQDFVSTLLLNKYNQEIDSAVSWKLRKDSYTDVNTGVTHVYVKQLVNGLEVADGDMNINVKDGKVISYGNSFFQGSAPRPFTSSDLNEVELPHPAYCQDLHKQREAASEYFSSQGGQVVLGEHKSIDLEHLINSHCEHPTSVPQMNTPEPDDFRHALMKFMLAATPDASVADAIQNDYPALLDKLEVTPTHHFADGESGPHFLVDNVPDTVNPVKAKMAYIQVPSKDGKGTALELVWKFEVEMQDNWYEAAVSTAAPHNIISVVDWASDASVPHFAPIPPTPESASYNVFKWGINDPSEGNRSIEKENFDPAASPVGWHALPVANDPYSKAHRGNKFSTEGWIERGIEFGKKWLKRGKDHKGRDKVEVWRNTTTTWGNNVFAQENWEGQNAFIDNYRPNAGPSLAFDYAYHPKKGEDVDNLNEAKKYINTTVAQLFYTTNLVHDLYYRYGFDEVSGNFQQHNFGRGGQENDAVIANAQDGSGYNNANFMTPPDGQNGRMRMYLWNTATPYRDGDLEAGIVIHELSHGLSTRLTGGPANSGCLGWGESGGMGEGWGDFLATIIRSGKNIADEPDYPMGAWAANRATGIRNFVYSLNETTNPSTYKTLDKPGYWGVHAIGEVWAEILWVVANELVKKHGAADDLFPPKEGENQSSFYKSGPSGTKVPVNGNTLIVQLVLNGMKLQPCRPSFFDARDAIIQADNILTGGENYCELWNGFSKRGLGQDAKVEGRTPWGGGIRFNGYKVPEVCA